MIAYIEGKILLKKDKFIIVQAGNIGYKVFLSRKSLSSLSESTDTIKAFCFHNITETASDLYGFLDYKEMEFFEILTDIRGIGPKAALEISSLGPLEKIKDKILAQDTKLFYNIPGIGSKKAMTIILELTGKIKMIDTVKTKASQDPAQDALTQLGFSAQQSKEALAAIPANVKNDEERIKEALKILGKS